MLTSLASGGHVTYKSVCFLLIVNKSHEKTNTECILLTSIECALERRYPTVGPKFRHGVRARVGFAHVDPSVLLDARI